PRPPRRIRHPRAARRTAGALRGDEPGRRDRRRPARAGALDGLLDQVEVGRLSLGALREAGFDVLTRNHAEAILIHDFPRELDELVRLLLDVRIDVAELIAGGGGESAFTQRLRRSLARA